MTLGDFSTQSANEMWMGNILYIFLLDFNFFIIIIIFVPLSTKNNEKIYLVQGPGKREEKLKITARILSQCLLAIKVNEVFSFFSSPLTFTFNFICERQSMWGDEIYLLFNEIELREGKKFCRLVYKIIAVVKCCFWGFSCTHAEKNVLSWKN